MGIEDGVLAKFLLLCLETLCKNLDFLFLQVALVLEICHFGFVFLLDNSFMLLFLKENALSFLDLTLLDR